jgi:hypothetical protein
LPLGLINSPSLIWTGCFQKTSLLPVAQNALGLVGRSIVLRTFAIVSVSFSPLRSPPRALVDRSHSSIG